MAIDINIPTVGESITDGVLAKWHVKNGEWIDKGKPVLDFETDKITEELPAPESGVIEIITPEGETVDVGATVAKIDPDAPKPEGQPAPAETSTAPAASAETSEPSQPEPVATATTQTVVTQPVSTPQPQAPAQAESPKLRLAPAARRLIEEEGLNPNSIEGSGRGGVITKPDVIRALKSGTASQKPAQTGYIDEGLKTIQSIVQQPKVIEPSKSVMVTTKTHVEREKRVPMTRLRQTIAKRLVEAKNQTAMLTTFNEVDMSSVMDIRKRYQEQFVNRYDIKLGFMSFFVKACIDALRMYPAVNARIDETDIVYQNYYNIGIAVGTEKGLIVPVLRDTDTKNFADIEGDIKDFAIRARNNKIEFSELQEGTFTITNGGIYGSMLSTPILNPPQVGILGMHNIVKKPVVIEKEDGDEIAIRPMMYIALSYDHRIIDGKEAVGFLIRVKECIENPERMLLEM